LESLWQPAYPVELEPVLFPVLEVPLLASAPLELDAVMADPLDEEAEPEPRDVEEVPVPLEVVDTPLVEATVLELEEPRLELPVELPEVVSDLLVVLFEKLP
jgi:hypothetical protein